AFDVGSYDAIPCRGAMILAAVDYPTRSSGNWIPCFTVTVTPGKGGRPHSVRPPSYRAEAGCCSGPSPLGRGKRGNSDEEGSSGSHIGLGGMHNKACNPVGRKARGSLHSEEPSGDCAELLANPTRGVAGARSPDKGGHQRPL